MNDLTTAIDFLNSGGIANIAAPPPEAPATGAPTIYDRALGTTRPATQADIDRALVLERAYDQMLEHATRLRELLTAIDAGHAEFVREIRSIA